MKQKRIPCPHCGELILPRAKKCRFCKERLDDKSLTLQTLYKAWALTLILFFVLLFFIRRAEISTGSGLFLLSLLGLDVLGGVAAYLSLMMKILSSLKLPYVRWYGLASLVTFFVFFGLLFNYEKVEAGLGFTPPSVQQYVPTPAASPSPVRSPDVSPAPTSKPALPKATTQKNSATNTITCTGPDGKSFQTTQQECDTFNKAWGNSPAPDPHEYIRCDVHPNCGGGYKEMTRESCQRIVCCQANNSWVLRDKDQCNSEQKQQTDAEWTKFCNDLHNPDSCSTYWEERTSGWFDCRTRAYDGRISCYNNR